MATADSYGESLGGSLALILFVFGEGTVLYRRERFVCCTNLILYPIYKLGWQEDVMFSVKLYTQTEWMERSFTPFYKNIEKEGIVL